MKPPAFHYVRPATLAQALQVLHDQRGQARILAGGQSLVPMMNARLARPDTLIDINRLEDLATVRVEDDELVIGALVRHSALLASPLVAASCPLMTEAYPHVAHLPIRNRGTLGGNISHADPASEMPAVLLAANATVVASSVSLTRRIPAQDFFIDTMTTALAMDEMVVAVHVPVAPSSQGYAFEEFAQRRGDFALAAVAVTVQIDEGRCTSVALALAGVEAVAARQSATEAILTGQPLNDAAIAEAADHVAGVVTPTRSYHADDVYKRDLVRVLVDRALRRARSRAAGA